MHNIKTLALTAISLFTLNMSLSAQEYTSTYEFILRDSVNQVSDDNATEKSKKAKKPKLTKSEREAATESKQEQERQYREWVKEQKRQDARYRDTLREEARQNREWLEIAEREARLEQAQQKKALRQSNQSSNSVEGHVECDFLSQYLWRGIEKGGISMMKSFAPG